MRNKPAILITIVVLLSLGAGRLHATTICEVQAYDPGTGFSPFNGQTVTLKGIVTVPVGVFQPTMTSIYIRGLESDDCGINVYSSTRVEDIGLGDTVTVTGTAMEYVSTAGNGATTEITISAASAVTVRRGNAIPEPVEMSTGQVGQESNEGKFVRITANLASGVLGRSFIVDDGTGELEIFDLGRTFTADSTWRGLTFGDQVTVTGIVSQSDPDIPFLSDYSLIPRSPRFGDVTTPLCIPGGSAGAALSLSGSVFSPLDEEKITIIYNSPHGTRMRLRIYDVYGRCVANLDDRISVCGESQIAWDGRNEVLEELPAGLYHVVVTAVNAGTGQETQETVPVVIGRRLR